MKKTIYFFELICVCYFMIGCSEKELDKKLEETFEAYIQCIKDYVSHAEYDASDSIRYTLVYINDDNIPELAISEGNSHAAGVRIYYYDFNQKKVIDTGDRYGENGGFSYYNRKSMIYDHYFGNGGYDNACFCYFGSDYKVTRGRWFTSYSDEKSLHYWIDFEETSKEEYDKAYTEDAQKLADQDMISVVREDMMGNYQICCSKDAIIIFCQMLNES